MQAHLLLRAHEAAVLAVHVYDFGVHARHQCCLHHCPVLRVQVHVADVASAPRSHKTCGGKGVNKELLFIFRYYEGFGIEVLEVGGKQVLVPPLLFSTKCRLLLVIQDQQIMRGVSNLTRKIKSAGNCIPVSDSPLQALI